MKDVKSLSVDDIRDFLELFQQILLLRISKKWLLHPLLPSNIKIMGKQRLKSEVSKGVILPLLVGFYAGFLLYFLSKSKNASLGNIRC